MPDDPLANAVETFSAPIEHLIIALGKGISEAQLALDRNSIQTQNDLDTDPVLSQYGFQAVWYQFPKVDLQLKLAVTISQDQSPSPPPSVHAIGAPSLSLANRIALIAQPVSAAYQTQFNYDASASSVLSLSIVPVPPARAAGAGTAPPNMTAALVSTAALASSAKFAKDAHGNPVPTLLFVINFNSATRSWYVLQYDPANPTAKPVLVSVDDATGMVRVIGTP
jgi:hypothetical protein